MGILDDAIREHLDLKRKHGARDSEISEIEDEALGSGDRPDPFAAGELFGNVSSPGAPAQEAPAEELEEPPPGEEPTALVEPPSTPLEPPRAEPPEPSFPEPPAESESIEDLMAEEEASGPPEGADTSVPPPPPPETEAAARPGGEPASPVEPSESVLESSEEPREEPIDIDLGPEPPPPPPPAATEGQRGRALGRADVPTQEHIPSRQETGDAPPVPSEPEPPPEEGGPQLYDFETDPGLVEEGADPGAAPPAEESDDFEALGPVDEAEEAGRDIDPDEEEPYGEQRGGTTDFEEIEVVEEDRETKVRPAAPPDEDEEGFRTEVRPADPDDEEEDDLLSESPEFLDKDTDEGLWFEKGPPKDFDFEDEDEDER
jgi:hypothetical protein